MPERIARYLEGRPYERQFREGMRVVITSGDWPVSRVAGTYGKIVKTLETKTGFMYRIVPMGHVDGQPILSVFDDPAMLWLFPDELEVVD